ncbi:MAG: murein biosynthesis integral membrane protein MurJ [Victivallaceae bacterium]|nr:murein biosynthesis integral membrane protein MurJ [Victivallaceae bacterium]
MNEKDSNKSITRHSFAMSIPTLASRLLGLVRVKLEASVLGAGEYAAAWYWALSIPSLFRRTLGEGALSGALIPLLAEIEREKGREETRQNLAVVFAVLGIVLALIVVITSGLAMLLFHLQLDLGQEWNSPRVQLGLRLVPILMPYAFFMCLVGVIGAVLNYARVFMLPAAGALLLNIFMISTLSAIQWGNLSHGDMQDALEWLGWSVIMSGMVQFVLMYLALAHYKHAPIFRKLKKNVGIIKRLWTLMIPGVIGGTAVQLSFFVDRTIAIKVGAQAVPSLSFVDRIIDIPIGLFAVSMGAVLMASMSRSAAKGDIAKMSSELVYSLRHVMFVCIPIAVAVIVFHRTFIWLICVGGKYAETDVKAANAVAIFYGLGLPLFCTMKIISPMFLARKKVIPPLIATSCAVTLNIILDLLSLCDNIIPVGNMKQGWIALATVISSVLNISILLCLLRKEGIFFGGKQVLTTAARTILALLPGTALVILLGGCEFVSGAPWMTQFARCAGFGALFVSAYLAVVWIFKFPEFRELFGALFGRNARE